MRDHEDVTLSFESFALTVKRNLVLDFFHTGISFSICWIYVGRIRRRSGDNCPIAYIFIFL